MLADPADIDDAFQESVGPPAGGPPAPAGGVCRHLGELRRDLADGPDNPHVQREGIVLRPLVEEYDDDIGGRLSFKAINPKFLLKYDE